MWRQGARTARCPDTPRLDGKLALVTGGASGIGFETSLGLARRGASVIVLGRNRGAGEAVCARIVDEVTGGGGGERGKPRGHAEFVRCDLSDLGSIRQAGAELLDVIEDRELDLAVFNAGVWPKAWSASAQGHEMAFATNVLGHHALWRSLGSRLRVDARLVFVTGDLYITARECTPDFRFTGAGGGQAAYCRSKLGNVWQALETARRHPRYQVAIVHPGVALTGLGGGAKGIAAWLGRRILADVEAAAQTTLRAAVLPLSRSPVYLHNTLGELDLLHPSDPASDRAGAARLWACLEGACDSAGIPPQGESAGEPVDEG
ncbi:MAG: SDR family NAD(P)-dependent oxidoreductase [Phycisphaerales bacterium]